MPTLKSVPPAVRVGNHVKESAKTHAILSPIMSTVARDILEGFDELAESDKQEVACEILRRTRNFNLPPLSDEELVLNAEELFLELDRREAQDAQS